MTREEAEKLVSFKAHCQCAGFRWPFAGGILTQRLSGRKERDAHSSRCPQAKEYVEWFDALGRPNRMPEEAA